MSQTQLNLPSSTCPQCRYQMNSAINVHGGQEKPTEGCLIVCLNCGQLLVYRGDLTLRKPTPREVGEVMKDRDVWRTIEHAQLLIRQRGPFK